MNVIKQIYFIIILIFALNYGKSQSGGDAAYDFLNLTNSARVASLGGQQISIDDDDLNFVFHNPSLLSSEMDNHLVLNYVNYFAGVNYGYASYARSVDKLGNLAAGVHYIYYGEFVRANDIGLKTGTFRAADYALNLFYSRPVFDSLFQAGINFKPIYSDLETYMSFAIALDGGITYTNADKLFSAALVFKNAGFQLIKYYPDQPREPLPFEIQLGVSQRLRYAPFRFSILAHHLETPNLRYETEEDKEDEIDLSTGLPKEEDKLANFADNLMRHMIFGIEFIPSKNFNIRLGYNYKRRQEMKIKDRTAMVGFSYGFGIRISKFHISYGRATYHVGGASNHFSVSMNLSEFNRKL